MRTVTIKK